MSYERRRFIEIAGTFALFGIAGCLEDEAGSGPTPETESKENGEPLSWHAGGTAGTYYPLSGDFKSIVDAETPYSLQVQSTGASVENVGSLHSEDANFALIQNDIAHFAHNGTGLEEFQGQSMENIRGVATLYPETIHVISQAGSGLERIQDLSGKSVNTGDLGSGTQVNALQILETAGVKEFDEQNTDFETAANQIRDGDVDAAFVVGGWPVGAVEELATTEDIGLVEISGGLRENLMNEAEWFAEDTVPGGTYDGIEEDVETVSVQAMIATHEAMDEGTVEAVTTAIFDNLDQVTHKQEFISVDTAQDGMPIPVHPGAEAYFN
ncbi:TAXI family TRAP transporter solute-binding subunit [Halocatena salina]|uniref:TAXI family TRAP transporter solute-binding subunit n=1 Tax=Halocatena salina TaxID=2934340 RepID=A0A8U0A2W4_9EURY|nr:TAXI family TRAP transporter solute-binding subunit [Halocatena salina]UPM42758.1 TAXI family TRAP transporter solute-binding subunit [Halocatena salina]